MTAKNKDKQLAKQLGLKVYTGMICAKHPELMGKRSVLNSVCGGCNLARTRERREKNPEEEKAKSRAAYLKNRDVYLARGKDRGRLRRTGFTPGLFYSLLEFQNYKCGICERKIFGGRETHSDHCHEANIPRGLLCSQCNQAEGMIAKSGISAQEWIKRLMEYLNNPPVQRMKLQ